MPFGTGTVVRRLTTARHKKRLHLAIAIAALLSGCTTLRIEANPGEVVVSRQFGVLYLSISDAGRAHAASLTSLGIANTPMGFSVGYSSQQWLHMPDDSCRLVLWVDDPALLRQVRQIANEIPQACVVANTVMGE